jgi:hypothetical protein
VHPRFLPGGPSHLDLWDLKPEAPEEIRGPFRPVGTSVPGLSICEHLPRVAQQMHRCTLVRSVHHRVVGAHPAAAYLALTGHDRGDLRIRPTPEDYPAIGSVLSLRRPPSGPSLPYVALPHTVTDVGEFPVPGFFGGFLGRTYDPFFIQATGPADPSPNVSRKPSSLYLTGLSLPQIRSER